MLSTKLTQRAGMFVMTVMTLVAIALATFPAPAEAQEGTMENAGQGSVAEPTTATPQAANEPTTRLVVEPGDCLWTITRDKLLSPNATPQQIANEVERISELNREQIGDDPNLILPGQELLINAGTEPVADTSAPEFTTTGVEGQPTAEQATSEEPTPEPTLKQKEEVAANPSSTTNLEPSYPAVDQADRGALGTLPLMFRLGLLLFAIAVAFFGALKIFKTRRLLGKRHKPLAYNGWSGHHENHAGSRQHEQEEQVETEAAGQTAEGTPETPATPRNSSSSTSSPNSSASRSATSRSSASGW